MRTRVTLLELPKAVELAWLAMYNKMSRVFSFPPPFPFCFILPFKTMIVLAHEVSLEPES